MKNLLLISLLFISSVLTAQDITGEWNGALDIQGMQLRIVFHIEKTNDGYSSKLDSPDQGATGIPTSTTTFDAGQLTITAATLNMNFEGRLASDGSSINGTFNQNGLSFPLDLQREKIEKKIAPTRPQEPNVFNYTQLEMRIKNAKGGHELAGTLTMPKNAEAKALVILITGSGPQDRNEELGPYNHRPFLVLSDFLTRNGIAVFRYDDRGIAESGGDFATATSKDFADDASAIVDFFSKDKMFIRKKIGLIGHSEGGMIAPIVAVENKNVDFIVLLAGPGIPIKELMNLQLEALLKAEGVEEDVLKINSGIMDELYSYMIEHQEQETDTFIVAVKEILTKGAKLIPEEYKADWTDEVIQSQTKQLSSPWFRYFASFNPADYLTKVKCPVLAVNGTLDLQVTSKENLAGIENCLDAAGNKHFTIEAFDGLNHLFQKAETGAPAEYGTIEETFNEEVMKYLVDWINQQY